MKRKATQKGNLTDEEESGLDRSFSIKKRLAQVLLKKREQVLDMIEQKLDDYDNDKESPDRC